MRNFITNFRKILGICKQFAGNQVNEKGNVARCGVIHSYDMTADNVKTYNIFKMEKLRASPYSISSSTFNSNPL